MSDYVSIARWPTILEPDDCRHGTHESVLRAWHILEKTKELLRKSVPTDVVLELINLMEDEIPRFEKQVASECADIQLKHETRERGERGSAAHLRYEIREAFGLKGEPNYLRLHVPYGSENELRKQEEHIEDVD
jgi:hypothetical protein